MSMFSLLEKPENNYFSPMYYVAKCFREESGNLQLKNCPPTKPYNQCGLQMTQAVNSAASIYHCKPARGVRWKDC